MAISIKITRIYSFKNYILFVCLVCVILLPCEEILCQLLIAVINTVTRGSLWGGELISGQLTLLFQSLVEGSQSRSSKQAPGGGNLSNDHGGLQLTGLLSMAAQPALFYSPETLPRGDSAHSGWAFRHLSKKMAPRLAYRAVSHSIFSVEVPLPSDLSLCQVDKIINQHTIFPSAMWGLQIEVRPQALPR